MNIKRNKIELLAPAGNLEKLKYALHYGADAVYAGMPDFSLRVRINNFDEKSIHEAVRYVHKAGKKIYLTLNIYAHNKHLAKAVEHIEFLKKLGVDGIILSDPGILNLVKKYYPQAEIHLSTQANATNWQAVKFWYEQGVRRVILAREVTLEEIREIKKRVPEMQLEYFIHGAMCMSYSGRCILSKWMSDRSANLGDCTQPCRWKYDIKSPNGFLQMGLEETMKKISVDLEEDQHGTHFFNSCDLNLIEYIKDLDEAGIDSLKIEGRAKSVYYVSVVAKAYRKVIDAVCNKETTKKDLTKIIRESKRELDNLANRGYTTGFLLGKEPEHNFSNREPKISAQFVGEIVGIKDDLNIVKVHNAILKTDQLEAVDPDKVYKLKIGKIFNHKMEEVCEAHGGHSKLYYFKFNKVLSERSLIRKKL